MNGDKRRVTTPGRQGLWYRLLTPAEAGWLYHELSYAWSPQHQQWLQTVLSHGKLWYYARHDSLEVHGALVYQLLSLTAGFRHELRGVFYAYE